LFKNKWKLAFFILAGLLVLGILVLGIQVLKPVDERKSQTVIDREEVPFEVTTKKEDLTKLINYYLQKEGLTGSIHYEVNLTDEVELIGTLPIFNTNIQMKLTFEPFALESGDLLLKQKEISIGQLPLPVSYIMNFIATHYDFPTWVDIEPNNEQIYVYLTEMNIDNGLKMEVQEFNLEENRIQFNLLLPTE